MNVLIGAAMSVALVVGGCDRAKKGKPNQEVTPREPLVPEQPQLADWSCPEGWATEPAYGVGPGDVAPPMICIMPPVPESCPPGSMPVVGETTCQTIGDPCPVGDWPEGLPDQPIIYVRPGGSGDGSTAETPVGTLADGFAAAPDNAILALAKGTFLEELDITRPVSLWGACALETIIEATFESDNRNAVVVGASHVTVQNITITGPQPGIGIGYGAESVRVRGIWCRGSRGLGIEVGGGASADIEEVLITDVQSRDDPVSGSQDDSHGYGMLVYTGGRATARRITVERSRSVGIYVSQEASSLDVSQVVVRDCLGQEKDGLFGIGMVTTLAAHSRVEQALVERNRDAGIAGENDHTLIEVSDSVVQGTVDSEPGTGEGLRARLGSMIVADRVLLDGNRDGAVAIEEGSTVRIQDALVRNGVPMDVVALNGMGLRMNLGGRVEAQRVVLDANSSAGAQVNLEGSELLLADSIVRGTHSHPWEGTYGNGLAVLQAKAEVSRVHFVDNHHTTIAGEAADITLCDVVVRGTRASPEGFYLGEEPFNLGIGLFAQVDEAGRGCRLTMRRALFVDNEGVGVFVASTATEFEADDLVVKETLSTQDEVADAGVGLIILGAQADLERVLLEHNRLDGLAVLYGADVNVRDLVVQNTLRADCATGPCEGLGEGTGVTIIDGSLTMEVFEIRDNAFVGLQVIKDAETPSEQKPHLRASHGRISRNLIGLHVHAGGFDPEEWFEDVEYIDNDQTYAGDELPLPNPLSALRDGP
ncbi:right-handed parallel beta-helix repeat-containing protein [Myxococcota bacterium]